MASNILEQPTNELLQYFGQGAGMPGSGGVSILATMASTQLLASVCKLTLDKPKYAAEHEEVQTILTSITNTYLPRMEQLMVGDIAVVKNMLQARIQRDQETDADKKEILKQKAQAMLEGATNTVLQYCKICIELLPKSLYIYHNGLRSAQGDTAAVVSQLIAGANAALYAAMVNIKAGKEATWVTNKKTELTEHIKLLEEYSGQFDKELSTKYNQIT